MSAPTLSSWILLAPLAAAIGFCLWHLVQMRALRVAVPTLLLICLAFSQLTTPMPTFDGPLDLIVTGQLGPLSVRFAIHVLAATLGVIVVRILRERDRAEAVQWRSMESVRALSDFFAAEQGPFEDRLAELLAIGCRELELPIAILARVDGDRYEVTTIHAPESFELTEGDSVDLARTFCRYTLESGAVLAVESLAQRTRPGPRHQQIGYQSYLGTPIAVDGQPYGTLCFASPQPRAQRFTGVEKQLLELMSHWVEGELTRAQLTQEKRLVPRRGEESDRRRVDVNAALGQIEAKVREAVASSGPLTIVPGDLHAVARMYRYEFDRVYWSLVLHAAGCCAPGEGVTVTSDEVLAAQGRRPDSPSFITLAVTGHGPALRAIAQEKLFSAEWSEPPRLAAPADSIHPNKEGVLSLDRIERLLGSIGGDLSITSEDTVGTTFTAWLPSTSDSPGPA